MSSSPLLAVFLSILGMAITLGTLLGAAWLRERLIEGRPNR
ncbi:MAG: hypothetical protein ACR2OC_05325 [Solirubrobacterales bacterium]